MYPNLYYVFKDFFGVEWHGLAFLNCFGLFVAIAFMVAAVVLSAELKRKEKQLKEFVASMEKANLFRTNKIQSDSQDTRNCRGNCWYVWGTNDGLGSWWWKFNITNGIITKLISSLDVIPEGFKRGRTLSKKFNITDGVVTKLISILDDIPEGFRRGRTLSPRKK